MGKLPRRIPPANIKGYVFLHDKVFLKYDDDEEKEFKEVILILAVEDEEDKIKLLALCEIFMQGFRSGKIITEPDTLPRFLHDATKTQKEALQVLLQHIINNSQDIFGVTKASSLAKKYCLAKPIYRSKTEIEQLLSRANKTHSSA